jgi:hypothetical protein
MGGDAANVSSFTTVVPKVWVTGSSSVVTICELSLFDVLFSPMLRGFSPGSPVLQTVSCAGAIFP